MKEFSLHSNMLWQSPSLPVFAQPPLVPPNSDSRYPDRQQRGRFSQDQVAGQEIQNLHRHPLVHLRHVPQCRLQRRAHLPHLKSPASPPYFLPTWPVRSAAYHLIFQKSPADRRLCSGWSPTALPSNLFVAAERSRYRDRRYRNGCPSSGPQGG